MDGSKLGAVHTRGGEARVQLYTSPSVRYSGLKIYTSPIEFEGNLISIVMQCRQKPGYSVCGETIGGERDHPGVQISQYFRNSRIERYTRAKGTIIPYRILVKLHPLGHLEDR